MVGSGQDPQVQQQQPFHISNLYNSTTRRDQSKIRLYERVLAKILERIKNFANYGLQYQCMYQTPEFMIGEPHYDVYECSGFVVTRLRTYGFDTVQYYHPNIIYVNWYTEYARKQQSRLDLYQNNPSAQRSTSAATSARGLLQQQPPQQDTPRAYPGDTAARDAPRVTPRDTPRDTPHVKVKVPTPAYVPTGDLFK